MRRALVTSALLAALILVIGAPAGMTAVAPDSVIVSGADLPRGLWCNAAGILTLPGGLMIAPLNAVDLIIIQGKVLETAGLVSAADWAPGVGAFCPGAPQVAGKKVTLAGTKVNNLGQIIPGDPGAIYNLATVA